MILLASITESTNKVIFIFEIIALIVGICMIIVGLIQNKQAQTGLSALNGGNEELFSNSKERGLDRVMSIWMMSLGIILFVMTMIICILTNTIV